MKMKRNTDWTDVMRDALRDAEVSPSEGGWERLLRDLDAAAPQPGTPGPLPPDTEFRAAEPFPAAAPRRSVWRIYGPRIAAAAAAVLICVVAVEYLWRPDSELGGDVPVIASVTERGDSAVDLPQDPGMRIPDPGESRGETLRESLARATGWSQSPAAKSVSESAAGPATGKADATKEACTALLAEAATAEGGASRAALLAEDETVGEEAPRAATPGADAGPAADPAGETTANSSAEPFADASVETSADAGQTTRARSAADPLTRTSSADSNNARYRSARTYDLYADEISDAAPRRKPRASFSLFAAGGTSSGNSLRPEVDFSSAPMGDVSSIIGNGNNFSPLKWRNYDESSFRHHLPLSFGLSFSVKFPYGLSVESGVNYTLLRSDVRMEFSSEDLSQKLHFIGVPLRLNWQFVERGRFSAYLAGGGMVEKCVSATLGGRSVDESALQWSLLAALGAQYRLGDMVGLYFEPEVSYYLTDTELRTSRSDAPLTLTLRIGVRLLF